MNFDEFENGPAGNVFAGLGEEWADLLQRTDSFADLRSAVINRNTRPIGSFAAAARRYARTCSSGELRLLLAVLSLADFAHLSDELADGKAWQHMTMGCDRRYRAAIAACMMEAP
ncbi:hypothetical protein [Bradyrhizobium sp. WSM2254]|uniref:hypothetical protein n=1 Tax=Bradyrhizobium sp. WSM2254 TaxID=1188263 RepID=UPI00041A8FAB|nr:hypothetical protein [Bradyrhizobium sp. WSM2254]